MNHPTWLIFVFLVETGFHHVDQAGLELLTSGDPLTVASQSDGITGGSPCPAQSLNYIFRRAKYFLFKSSSSLFFFLMDCASGVIAKKSLLKPSHKHFILLEVFRSVFHFELFLCIVPGMNQGSFCLF